MPEACLRRGEGGSAAFGDNAPMPLPPDIAALRPELEAGLLALGLDPQATVERTPPSEAGEDRLAGALLAYLALLQRWNAAYNLTAIREPREMLVKHLLDSLAMQPHVRGLVSLADLLNATRNLHQVESQLNGFLREYYLGFADLLEASGLAEPLP